MLYLKATVVGVLVGLLVAVLWVLGNVALPLYLAQLLSRFRDGGVGAVGGYVGSDSTTLVAFIGFIAGFIWTVRRARRSAPAN
jgi:hypothetical protein